MHCCPALRALSLPHKPLPHHLTTTAMFHYEQTHHPPEIFPRSYLLLRPPALTQKEAVLPGSLVKSNAAGTLTSLTFSSENIYRHRVHHGFWKCGSPSPEVKNTHLTTEPDCVLRFTSLLILIEQHSSEAFFVLFYVSLPLTLFRIGEKKKVV